MEAAIPFVGPVFNLPTNEFYPAVEGTVIDSEAWNAIGEDLANGLTACLTRDGAGSMASDLNMGSNKIESLAAATNPSDAVRYDQVTPVDPDLIAWGALSWAAGKIGAATGAAAFTLFDYTTAGMAFLNYTDPGADKIVYWKDADGTIANVSLGTGLAFSSGTLALNAALQIYAGITPSANMQTFLGAVDYAAMRTQMSLTALATTSPGTGVTTALAVNVGSAGAFVVNGGALGTPSSGVLTNCTGLPNASVVGLGTAALKNTGTSGNNVPLLDGANTHSGVATFSAGAIVVTGSQYFQLNTTLGALAQGFVTTGLRFGHYLTGTESGANAGANYRIAAYSDAGGFVADVLTITRSTQVVNFNQTPTVAGVAVPTISSSDTLSNKTLSSPTISGAVAFGSGRFTGGEVRNADDSAFFSWYNGANSTRSGYMQLTSGGAGTFANEISGGSWSFNTTGGGVSNFNSDVVGVSVGPTSVYSLGYRGAPLGNGGSAANSAYTFVLADAGCTIYHDEVTARTYTIPANGSVAYPVGTVIVIDNTGNSGSAGSITLSITTDTLRRGDGVSGTGSRTIPASAVAAVRKVAPTVWVITGTFT